MLVDGEWQTLMSTGSSLTSLYTNNAEDNYVARWFKSATYSGTDNNSARAYFKLLPSATLSHYGTDNLKDPLRVEMRHLVTAPWLPDLKHSVTSTVFTYIIKYYCEDNTGFST